MTIEFTQQEICFKRLPAELDGLRILHVGDQHTYRFDRGIQRLYEIMRQEPWDMVVFSGDFCHQLCLGNPVFDTRRVKNAIPVGLSKYGYNGPPRIEEAFGVCQRLLEGFQSPLGVYVVQGNHDPDQFMQRVAGLDLTVLDNDAVAVESDAGGKLNICGVNCDNRGVADIPATLSGLQPGLFTIALSHFPEYCEALAAGGADLILSGHTHGGQICLPGGKMVITHSRTGYKYASGLTKIGRGGSYSFTTRGLGTSMIPLRTFCPAEVVGLTLRKI